MKLSSKELLEFIGRSSSAPNFDAWLTTHRIHERPHLAKEDESYRKDKDQAERNARSSEIDEVERHSLALIYDPTQLYRSLYDKADQKPALEPGNFVLREVALFGPGVQDYKGFADKLPWGLVFGMSPEQTQTLLGEPLARRTIHELITDQWAPPGWMVNASYRADGGLGIVHMRHQNLYDRRMLGLETLPVGVKRLPAEPVLRCLGLAGDDALVRDALAPIGWDADSFDLSEDGEITNYVSKHGVTLYFGGEGKAPSTLSGIRMNRCGDMRSRGYVGALPHGIEFHTTPLQLEQLVGREPDRINQASDTGSFLWSFRTYELHVMYSLIDFQVYRVSVHLN